MSSATRIRLTDVLWLVPWTLSEELPVERTFVMVKPDGVQRGLVGEVIRRFERKGLKLAALKMVQLSRDQAVQLYSVHRERPFFEDLIQFVCSGPVVAMVWEGPEVVAVARRLIGATNAAEAAPGTVRGDFGISTQMNLVHASDSPVSVARELPVVFDEHELVSYQQTIQPWLGHDAS